MSDFYEFPDVVQEVRGALNPGRLKLQSSSVTFKNIKTGKVDTYQGSDIESTAWLKRCRGYCLKIVLHNGHIHRYDGMRETEFEKLQAFVSKNYSVSLEKVDLSLKGWNWGSTEFKGNGMNFKVNNNLAFEVPLNNVSHTTSAKNEVTVEFHPNDDVPVSLMELRFHIPTTDQTGDTDPVQEFYENVMEKADVIQATGESIAIFQEVQCLTPRGRYDFKLYPTFIQLHGKTFDYKIPYATVIRLFLLPHKDARQMFFIVSLDPPIKQGQTRYHFIIMLFNKEDELTLELNMEDEELQKKYDGRLERHMNGFEHEVVSKMFRAVTNRKITVPGSYVSQQAASSVNCSYKASTGSLYPLERGFLFIHKPPVHIRFDEVSSVNFARSSANLRSFDFEVETKTGGTVHAFGNIDKDEYGRLYDFVSGKKLRVKNTGKKEDKVGYDDMVDSDEEDKGQHDAYLHKMKQEGKTKYEDDDDSDSTDESYNPLESSSCDEEYDSNPPTTDTSDSEGDSGSGKEGKKKEKKKRKSAKTVPEEPLLVDVVPKSKKKGVAEKTSNKSKQKKKKKKYGDEPKRPQTSYFLWLNENRSKIKDENPGISVTDLAKKGGEMWKEITESDKSKYDKQQEEAKRRYEIEMQAWRDKHANDPSSESEEETPPAKKGKPSKPSKPKPKSAAKSPSKEKGGTGDHFKSKEFISDESSSSDSDKPLRKKSKRGKKKEDGDSSSSEVGELPDEEQILSSPTASEASASGSGSGSASGSGSGSDDDDED